MQGVMFFEGMIGLSQIVRAGRWAKWAAICVVVIGLSEAQGQATAGVTGAGTPAQIIFTMDFPGQQTPHYKISLTEDGQGLYEADGGTGEAGKPYSFSIGAAAAAPWFSLARELQFFRGEYAASRKVAFMGTKTFQYQGADGSGQTTFGYTENKKLGVLTSDALALAFTLQLGQQLLADSRFNRIAVDQDMAALKEALSRHTAAYPQAIAPVLAVLADDTKVVDRVRREATTMLGSVSPVN